MFSFNLSNAFEIYMVLIKYMTTILFKLTCSAKRLDIIWIECWLYGCEPATQSWDSCVQERKVRRINTVSYSAQTHCHYVRKYVHLKHFEMAEVTRLKHKTTLVMKWTLANKYEVNETDAVYILHTNELNKTHSM